MASEQAQPQNFAHKPQAAPAATPVGTGTFQRYLINQLVFKNVNVTI